jgi:UDP-GlcNAc:undecaprenyl-phosphate GlcNAc-1-phosphate transferase
MESVVTAALTALPISFLVSISLLLVLRPLAFSIGLVDEPGGRKTHHGDVPVIGGLAMFSGLMVAAIVGQVESKVAVPLLAASSLMVLVGLLDDRYELPPNVRLLAHIAASVILVLATGFSVGSLGNLLGFGDIRLEWAAVPFTVVAAIALINAFNMLDGLDGLAGGVGLIAFGALSVLLLRAGIPDTGLVALAMTGAVFGFLIFNVPARFNRKVLTFMGDAGSTLLGFVLAGLGLFAIQPERLALSPIIVLFLMPIPVFELFISTFRRLKHGLSPMEADRGHFHHRLIDAGFPVRLIFGLYFGFSLISATIGVMGHYAAFPDVLITLLFGGLAVLWLMIIGSAPRLAARFPKSLRRGASLETPTAIVSSDH